nr:hypothetical protein [Tanacetum cinerariifolium]GEW83382.1 hypothetical protein [Tanacetum cinerariifolium]
GRQAESQAADVQRRQTESQAQIYHIDLEHANKVLSMQDDEVEPAELQEVVEVVTTAKLITEVVTPASATITAAVPRLTTVAAPTLTTAPSAARRRKEVVIRDPEESARPSIIIHSEAKSKDKVIDHVQRKQKEDNAVKRYQALKRKPRTEAQARKNMMIYLRNVVGFKMYYFKGMTYDDIRPIFKKYFNSNVAFLQKTKEQMEEEDSRALKRLSESQDDKTAKKQKLDKEVEELRKHLMIVPNDDDDVYTEATPLALKVPVVDYEIYTENNKPYYKIKRAGGSHQLYLSFLSMLRNFDREDLEIITFTTTQLILLVERIYPLTRFTLDQMLNNVQLEVEEESKVAVRVFMHRFPYSLFTADITITLGRASGMSTCPLSHCSGFPSRVSGMNTYLLSYYSGVLCREPDMSTCLLFLLAPQFHELKVMAAPTIPVYAEENLWDPIKIRMHVVHPTPEHLLGVPIQKELTALRFMVYVTEAENASLHATIRTMEVIETVTHNHERLARIEIER